MMSQYSSNDFSKGNENTAWTQVLHLIEDRWTILDVGCSSGNLGAELILSKKCKVDGIEIDSKDAATAKSKLHHVEELDVETTNNLKEIFPDKYDAILMIDVIEHLVKPAACLIKLQDLLKPSGKIIFSIPNMAHISVRLALMSGDFTYTKTGLLDKTHLHFYTGETIVNLFTEAGLRLSDFNCSSLQYPDILHDNKLLALGLKTTDKKTYKNMLAKTHGNVYQYVGASQVAKGKIIKQPRAPEVNAHERDYKQVEAIISEQKRYLNHLEKSILLKDNHIQNLEKIIVDQKNRAIVRRVKRKINKLKG